MAWTPPEDMPQEQAERVLSGKECGAKKKQGKGYCGQRPTKGQKGPFPHRCKFHGGKSPGAPVGSANAFRHGIYSQGIPPGAEELYKKIGTGDVTEEIKMAKLRLALAYKAHLKQELDFAQLEEDIAAGKHTLIDEIIEKQEGVGDVAVNRSIQVKKKRVDYDALIERLIGQVLRLENQQLVLDGGVHMTPEERRTRADALTVEHTVFRIPAHILERDPKDQLEVLEALEEQENPKLGNDK